MKFADKWMERMTRGGMTTYYRNELALVGSSFEGNVEQANERIELAERASAGIEDGAEVGAENGAPEMG